MRRLLFFCMFIGACLTVEALFRWSNALELGWGWLAYRAAFYLTIFAATNWSQWRDRKRMGASGIVASSPKAWMIILALLFGGAGAVVSAWRAAEAVLTGRISVSTTPEIYTGWSANPQGFAIALGLDVFVFLTFIAFFAAGLWMAGDYLARRRFRLRP